MDPTWLHHPSFMDCAWTRRGSSMEQPCYSVDPPWRHRLTPWTHHRGTILHRGPTMEAPWIATGCSCTVHGSSMDPTWRHHGLSTEAPCTVHGLSMDLIWRHHELRTTQRTNHGLSTDTRLGSTMYTRKHYGLNT